MPSINADPGDYRPANTGTDADTAQPSAATNAEHGIPWAVTSALTLSEQMLQVSWANDDITEAEGEAIQHP